MTVNRITEAYLGAEAGGASTQISVPGGDVSIVATSTSSATSNVAGGAFGAIDIGAFLDNATIGGATRAFAGPGATVHAASLEIHATAHENAAATLTAVGGGLISGTGANATASITSVTEAFAGTDATPTAGTPGVTLAVTNAIDIVASSTGTAQAQAQGGAGGLLQVAALLASANDDGQTHAYIGAGKNSNVSAGSLNVEADGALSSGAQTFALGIGAITVSGASAQSTVGSSDPTQQTVAAFIDLAPGTVAAPGTPIVSSPGSVTVMANMTPHASATVTGVDAGILSVDAAKSVANAFGTTSSYLGDGVTVSAPTLTVDAQRQAGNGPTAEASATAGSGGILADVNAAVSSAASSGMVQAYTGKNVTLTGGDVTIAATNSSDQSASSTGVAVGGVLAIGIDVATASSAVDTSAQMGSGGSTMLTGTLSVIANGTDENDVTAVAGSGGIIAGHAVEGTTSDNSTVSSGLGGGSILATTVDVTATNNSGFVPNINSINAAVVGGSGAYANNTDKTTAIVSVANNVSIFATDAVNIAALNTYSERVPTNGNTIAAGAGGVVNGTAAESTTTLVGASTVAIGSSVSINVESPVPSPTSGIFLTASSVLTTSDQVTLSSGGAIEGAGTDSSLSATLNNQVMTSSSATGHDDFMTNQNIGIGTHSRVNASTDSEAHTWGVIGAVASSNATTDVTANEIVTLGQYTNLTAYQNINLTAGDDPTAGSDPSSIIGSANGQSYSRSLVAIPSTRRPPTSTATRR